MWCAKRSQFDKGRSPKIVVFFVASNVVLIPMGSASVSVDADSALARPLGRITKQAAGKPNSVDQVAHRFPNDPTPNWSDVKKQRIRRCRGGPQRGRCPQPKKKTQMRRVFEQKDGRTRSFGKKSLSLPSFASFRPSVLLFKIPRNVEAGPTP